MVAILEVDKEKLAETGHCFKEEMGRVAQSGIILREYKEANKESDFEYAAFVWNTDKQEYEKKGRSMQSEWLVRDRFYEYVQKGLFIDCYDTSRVVFKKRLVSVLHAEWEEIKEAKDNG